MTTKILTILAVIATSTALSAPVMANEEDSMLPSADGQEAVVNPEAPPPFRGNFVCYSRNISGRTFQAFGNFRTPQWRVQNRALQLCRAHSGFILGRTCRNVGCRRMGRGWGR